MFLNTVMTDGFERAFVQIILTFLIALCLMAAILFGASMEQAATSVLEKVKLEDVANPPPEPPHEHSASIHVTGSAILRSWDNFWGRRIPLLL